MKLSTESIHHYLKAAIMFGFALYISLLVKNDNMLYYIAPRMIEYVKWSSIAFYAMAAHRIYVGTVCLKSRTTSCDCGDDHDHKHYSPSLFKNIVIYGLFVFPLLLGFILPDVTMGSSLAAKKGVNLSSSSTVLKVNTGPSDSPNNTAEGNDWLNAEDSEESSGSASDSGDMTDEELDKLFPAKPYLEAYTEFAKQLYKEDVILVSEDSFVEILSTVDLYLDQFVGKKLELNGFVFRQDDFDNNQFIMARFVIQCCSADATPFGVLTSYDHANQLATDSWVNASGTIAKTARSDGRDYMTLQLEKYTVIPEPKEVYVYPNFNFGT